MVALAAICLAAFGSIEENPNSEILAEVFEAMLDLGRRKQDILGRDSFSCSVTNKLGAALRDDIELILGVWLLRVFIAGGVKFDLQ
jgi:hypothetical protein